MYNGLTVVAYNLRDVHPGDGGFGCVPGSHKANLPFPNEWRDLAAFQPFMRAVIGPAGGAGERRTLFFKYSPFPLSWAAGYYNPDDYADLTEAQRSSSKRRMRCIVIAPKV